MIQDFNTYNEAAKVISYEEQRVVDALADLFIDMMSRSNKSGLLGLTTESKKINPDEKEGNKVARAIQHRINKLLGLKKNIPNIEVWHNWSWHNFKYQFDPYVSITLTDWKDIPNITTLTDELFRLGCADEKKFTSNNKKITFFLTKQQIEELMISFDNGLPFEGLSVRTIDKDKIYTYKKLHRGDIIIGKLIVNNRNNWVTIKGITKNEKPIEKQIEDNWVQDLWYVREATPEEKEIYISYNRSSKAGLWGLTTESTIIENGLSVRTIDKDKIYTYKKMTRGDITFDQDIIIGKLTVDKNGLGVIFIYINGVNKNSFPAKKMLMEYDLAPYVREATPEEKEIYISHNRSSKAGLWGLTTESLADYSDPIKLIDKSLEQTNFFTTRLRAQREKRTGKPNAKPFNQIEKILYYLNNSETYLDIKVDNPTYEYSDFYGSEFFANMEDFYKENHETSYYELVKLMCNHLQKLIIQELEKEPAYYKKYKYVWDILEGVTYDDLCNIYIYSNSGNTTYEINHVDTLKKSGIDGTELVFHFPKSLKRETKGGLWDFKTFNESSKEYKEEILEKILQEFYKLYFDSTTDVWFSEKPTEVTGHLVGNLYDVKIGKYQEKIRVNVQLNPEISNFYQKLLQTVEDIKGNKPGFDFVKKVYITRTHIDPNDGWRDSRRIWFMIDIILEDFVSRSSKLSMWDFKTFNESKNYDIFKYNDKNLKEDVVMTIKKAKERLLDEVPYGIEDPFEYAVETLKLCKMIGYNRYNNFVDNFIKWNKLNTDKAKNCRKFFNRARKELLVEMQDYILKELEENPSLYLKYKDKLEIIKIPNWVKRGASSGLLNFK